LGNAHAPDQPDWTILSAQGVAADQQNDHQRARSFYKAALAIVPDEPSILTNLGLSYALSGDLTEAEQTLRKAVGNQQATVMTRKNLAMVLALRGKPAEAKTVVAQDMTVQEADQFVGQFKRGK
jgi:Flp pilus assembly protein TadD